MKTTPLPMQYARRLLATAYATALLIVLPASVANAQPVRVMPVTPTALSGGSGPTGYWLVNGTLFFNMDGGSTGRVLWKSDGTAAGTVAVKDVASYLWPSYTAVSGNRLFFTGEGVPGGLWVSDGTVAGTQLIWSGTVRQVVDVNGTVFFADDNRLYKTNGTAAGTVIVRQGAASGLTSMGGMLYFTATGGLWKSDGTSAGTVLVKAFAQVGFGMGTVHGGKLYFAASDGVNGMEPWVSDGTTAGTVLIKNINAGGDSAAFNFASAGSFVYFAADDGASGREIWKTDGTAAGTERVRDIDPGPESSYARAFTALGNQAIFAAKTAALGWQVWRTDGTEAGTAVVKQIGSEQTFFPDLFTPANGALCFVSTVNGQRSLWRTDGTEAGTIQLMADVLNGNLNLGLASTGTRVYFAKRTGTSVQIWSSDCTSPAGNVLVRELSLPLNNYPHYLNSLTSMGDHVMLSAATTAEVGQELWRADAAGGSLVKDVDPGPASGVPGPSEYRLGTPGGDYPVLGATLRDGTSLWFRGSTGGEGIELWRSDGTTAGTALVKDIRPGPQGSSPRFLTKVGSTIFFAANDGVSGLELWKTDGTAAGTVLVKDINPNGSSLDDGAQLVAVNGTLYFRADDGMSGVELWKSDGTTAGTVMVKDIASGSASSWGGGVVSVGGTLMFAAATPENGYELWKTDGTAAGTTLVKDIRPGPESGMGGPLVVMNGLAYFPARDGAGAYELWRSDGTEAGTNKIFTSSSPASFQRLTALGSKLYFFIAGAGVSGSELWMSDGTAAGTVRLRTFAYASTAVDKGAFVGLEGVVYFLEVEPIDGLSLWRTDGTPVGTYRIDLFPGFKGSNPVELTVLGDRLYFIANDGVNPRSLYYYVPRPPSAEITRLGNLSSRAQVQAGDNVMIGGFIIGGSLPKTVLVRARGPSLAQFGVPHVLANPQMRLVSGQTQIAANDNWGDAPNAAQVQASGFAPENAQESAILATLAPGAYTAIVTGVGDTPGIAIVEVFEVGELSVPLLNISTRGPVQTGDNVMIGGFIIQGDSPQKVVVRARGPSLAQHGLNGVLANPQLQLFSGQTQIAFNDNWQQAANAVEIDSSGQAPSDPNESAILVTLQPGAYTAIVTGVNGGTGIAIVEVFRLN